MGKLRTLILNAVHVGMDPSLKVVGSVSVDENCRNEDF